MSLTRRLFLRLSAEGTAAAVLLGCAPEGGDTATEATEKAGGGCDDAQVAPITDNDDFFVTSYSVYGGVDGADWRLVIDGACTGAAELTLADLDVLKGREIEQTLVCIGSIRVWIG